MHLKSWLKPGTLPPDCAAAICGAFTTGSLTHFQHVLISPWSKAGNHMMASTSATHVASVDQLHPHLRLHCADSPSECSAHLIRQTLSPLQCRAHPWASRGHLCSAVTQMSLLLLIAALLKPYDLMTLRLHDSSTLI